MFVIILKYFRNARYKSNSSRWEPTEKMKNRFYKQSNATIVANDVLRKFSKWENFLQETKEQHPDTCAFVARANTKHHGQSITKQIGCLLRKFTQSCIITHHECIFNETIYTQRPIDILFEELIDGEERTKKKERLSGQIISETARLSKELERQFSINNCKEQYQCYGIYVTRQTNNT